MKQAIFAYVNHARIHSWNKPVLSNEGSFLLKETTGAFDGLELMTDRHPPITSQTRYPGDCTTPPLTGTVMVYLFHYLVWIYDLLQLVYRILVMAGQAHSRTDLPNLSVQHISYGRTGTFNNRLT